MSQAGSFLMGLTPGNAIVSITGNVGGAVGPTLNNVNIVGDGVTVLVTGNPGTSTLTITNLASTPFSYKNVQVTPYIALLTDYYISVNSSTIAITIQLPNNPVAYKEYVIKDRTGNAGTNAITVTTPGGLTLIDGVASYSMNTNYQSINIVYNGTNYEVW